jgi:adenylyltransferase/sulfurtransferase
MKDDVLYERYGRQILLKEFGEAGQQKMLEAKILVIGAGGLGCAALQYLAAAGAGVIGVADDDVVSLNNLHRQILFSTDDIGLKKVDVAGSKLRQLNPGIKIIPLNFRLTNQNALDILADYDIVVDGTDNFSSRYLINDACVLLNKPLVFGAVSQFEGQVAVFNCSSTKTQRPINYRDLFPHPPKENEVLNCAEAGVLGVLPGIIGSMQANETIKLITGIGEPLADRLLTYNALTNNMFIVQLSLNKDADILLPKNDVEFRNTDYEWLCSAQINDGAEIDFEAFNDLLKKNEAAIIDVREFGEQPFVNEFEHVQVPLSRLRKNEYNFSQDTIVTFCQTGKRSLEAVQILRQRYDHSKKIYSLKSGITGWKNAKK